MSIEERRARAEARKKAEIKARVEELVAASPPLTQEQREGVVRIFASANPRRTIGGVK